MNKWWGYLHTNGNIQVKRFFCYEDLTEASESPFVQRVSMVVLASSRDEAVEKVKKELLNVDKRGQP